jgi:signal transduction histidine kinase
MTAVAQIAILAVGCAALIGLLGAAGIKLLQTRSLRWSLVLVAAVTVTAMGAGMSVAAAAMFVSEHDLGVALAVCASAGVAALAVALLLGRQVVASSQVLTDAVQQLGQQPDAIRAGTHGRLAPPMAGAEFAALRSELDLSARRLAESRQREQALERSRRELVAWVSHDLRTPLAGMRAMAEALEDGISEDPDRYHKQMRLEVDRLSAMVDDLFELSHIQAGPIGLNLAILGLSDLVSDAVAGAEPIARAHGVALTGRATGHPMVQVDAQQISRVLGNLIDNAIRHSPGDTGVSVTVASDSRAEQAVVAVEDGCGGIPAEDLQRVFDTGWRANVARSPGPDAGAGLGLAIVRGIVEAHAGTVTASNTASGCKFEIRLPLSGLSNS